MVDVIRKCVDLISGVDGWSSPWFVPQFVDGTPMPDSPIFTAVNNARKMAVQIYVSADSEELTCVRSVFASGEPEELRLLTVYASEKNLSYAIETAVRKWISG